MYGYAFSNSLNSAFLQSYVVTIVNGQTVLTPPVYITDANITIKNSQVFVLKYLISIETFFLDFISNNLFYSANGITSDYLVYYSTQITGSVSSFLNSLNILNTDLYNILTTYLTTIKSYYNNYLNGLTPTESTANQYMSTQIAQVTNLETTTFVNIPTNTALVILYQNTLIENFGKQYLQEYVANTSLTTYTYSIQNSGSYPANALNIFLTNLLNMFLSYVSDNNITTLNNSAVANFYAAENTQIEQLENNQIIVQFYEENKINITLAQSDYINEKEQVTNDMTLLKSQSNAYLNIYITDTSYTTDDYIDTNLGGNNGDVVLNAYLEPFLPVIFQMFIIYADDSPLTTQLIDSFFEDQLTEINNTILTYYNEQNADIVNITEEFISTLSLTNKSELVIYYLKLLKTNTVGRNTLYLISHLLKTNSHHDNFIHPSDIILPELINTSLFDSNTYFDVDYQYSAEVLFNGLIALISDVSTFNQTTLQLSALISDVSTFNQTTLQLRNSDFIYLLLYNYYLDHIVKDYITSSSFAKSKSVQDYVYPNPNWLNTTLGPTHATFDPNYSYSKDNVVLFNIVNTASYSILDFQIGTSTLTFFENLFDNAYSNYIDSAILNLYSYKSTDAYITCIKYLNFVNSDYQTVDSSYQMSLLSQQIQDNIYWGIVLNLYEYQLILSVLNNATFDNTQHYRIGMFNMYSLSNDQYSNTSDSFTIISNNNNLNLSDNLIQILEGSISGNIPSDVVNFFQNDVVNSANDFITACKYVIQNSSYTDYINNFELWQNLLINVSTNTLLASRLSQSNSTIAGQTLDYVSAFTSSYYQVAMINYVPYLVVSDIPALLNQVLQTTNIKFIPYSTDASSIYVNFINTFNLLDGDQNSDDTFYGTSSDLALKLQMYKLVAESIIVNVSNNTVVIVDDDYIQTLQSTYSSQSDQYMLSAIFRPEGLFPQYSTYDSDTSTVEDIGKYITDPIDYVCNTYLAMLSAKVNLFVTTYYPTSSGFTTDQQNQYISVLDSIMINVVNSFRVIDLPSYDAYVDNGYTLYNINALNGSDITNTTPLYSDAASSIWYQTHKLMIQKYNLMFNSTLLSNSYYDKSLGGQMINTLTNAQTQFVNSVQPFVYQSILVNFDTFGKKFLHSAGTNMINNSVPTLITLVLGLPVTTTTQYEIMIYQYIYHLVPSFLLHFETLLSMNPSNNAPDQVTYMINQYFAEQRNIITNFEMNTTAINLSVNNFGRNYFLSYGNSIVIDVNGEYIVNISKFDSTFTTYTNSTNSGYGTYVYALLNGLANLYASVMGKDVLENIIPLPQIVNSFYENYSESIVQLEHTSDAKNNYLDLSPLYNTTQGFAMTNISVLKSIYIYFSEQNPNPEILNPTTALFTPVVGTGYDFYILRISNDVTPNYTTLIDYASDLSTYFTAIYDNYIDYQNILHMRNDYNNITTNNGTVTKKTYLYDKAKNIINDFSQHTQITYVNGVYDSSSTTYSTLTNIINDTLTFTSDTYIGIMDVVTSANDDNQILTTGNLWSVNAIFSKTSSATSNPYDPFYYPHLYVWYNKYSNNPDFQINTLYSTFQPILNGISSQSFYNADLLPKLYGNFKTYIDIVYYIIDQLLKTTSLRFLVEKLDDSISLTLQNMHDQINNNVTLYKKNITDITSFTSSPLIPQKGFTFKFLSSSDIFMYTTSAGEPNLNQQLETSLLNIINKTSPHFAWVKELGHRIISSATVNVGGEDIETHSYNLLHLIHQLYDPIDQKRGYDIMIGNTKEMYSLGPEQRLITRLWIPMRFWFCRHVGCSLPLVSMLYSDVVIKFKLADLSDILYIDPLAKYATKPKIKCHMMAQYIYLEDDERLKMSKAKLEYLIERFMPNGPKIISKKSIQKNIPVHNNPSSQSVDQTIPEYGPSFSVPINALSDSTKYFLWSIKFFEFGKNSKVDIINWNVNGFHDLSGYKNQKIIFDQIKIKCNGRERESYKDEIFYTDVGPWKTYMGSLESGEYFYSLSLFPALLQPSGTANMSIIEDSSIIFNPTKYISETLVSSKVYAIVHVWGCAYNVFRVFSGIAAPLFIQP